MRAEAENLRYFDCENVNFTKIDDIVPDSAKAEFKKVILKRLKVFSTSNESLTFNASVIATIRTVSDELVYSKLYPYSTFTTLDFQIFRRQCFSCDSLLLHHSCEHLNPLKQEFPATKFWYCKNFKSDIINANEITPSTVAPTGLRRRTPNKILRAYYFLKFIRRREVAYQYICNWQKYILTLYWRTVKIRHSFYGNNRRTYVRMYAPILQLVNFYLSIKTIYCDNKAPKQSRPCFKTNTALMLSMRHWYTVATMAKCKDSTVP